MIRLSRVWSFQFWAEFITNPKNRPLHTVLIALALTVHLGFHYATYLPALRSSLGSLPYFRLHVLHEAEFLLIVVYAALVWRLKGGLVAVGATALTSIPFALTPYIFGRAPRTDETRDLVIQVAFILIMAVLMVFLYEAVARLRETRIALLARVEEANVQLQGKNEELQQVGRGLETANRQLTGLNQAIQTKLNHLFGQLQETVDSGWKELEAEPAQLSKERFTAFLHKLRETIKGE